MLSFLYKKQILKSNSSSNHIFNEKNENFDEKNQNLDEKNEDSGANLSSSLFENEGESMDKSDITQKLLKNSSECYKMSENFLKLNKNTILKEFSNENFTISNDFYSFFNSFSTVSLSSSTVNPNASPAFTSTPSSSLDNNYTNQSSQPSLQEFLSFFEKDLEALLSVDEEKEPSVGATTIEGSPSLYNELNLAENELIEGMEEWLNCLMK